MKKICRLMGLALISISTLNCVGMAEKQDGAYIGPSTIKIENGEMTPEVLLSFGRLSDPQLSPDKTKILYGVSYTSIEDNRSCRNIFVSDVDGSNKIQLTKSGSSISNARWIDGGKSIAYIKEGQIYVAPYKSGKLGKAKKISNIERGISEFKLSPDEKKVLFVSTVDGNVKTPDSSDPKVSKAKAYVTEDLMYRHWDHWVTEVPHTYIADFGTSSNITLENSKDILGADSKFELPIEPFSGIEQLSWSPDGKYVAYSCKKLTGKQYAFSTNTEIYIYNVENGAETQIPMNGGYDTDPVWSPDGSKIAWISMARDGYEADKTRLMTVNVKENDGKIEISDIKDLTANFKYNAAGPVWSEDSKSIYFNSLTEGLQAIYKAENDTIVRLTKEEDWFDFYSPFGILEDGTLLATYCSMDFPHELVSVKDMNFTQISHENEHILSQLSEHKTEAHWLNTVDGKKMLTWVLYPPQFDSTKVYPSIEILLGGPQGTLSQGWSYRWNYRLMAAQGYIVVLPNRRGTTAFGQEWTEQISGDYSGLNMQDYLTAAKWIKEKPYVGKLAGCGASYGGYSVYYLAGVHENTFDCFIAHAGIFDEKYMYYETEEMWFANWDNGGLTEYSYEAGQMGPKGDGITFGGMQQAGSPWSSLAKPKHHYTHSPNENVTKWNTPILCIHGEKDFRIPYDQGMAAFNAAQMMGVPSKLVVFPEENHWILKPQNSLFWHRTYFDWLDRWCKEQK